MYLKKIHQQLCLFASALLLCTSQGYADTSLTTFSVKGVVTASTNVEVSGLTGGVVTAFSTITDSDFLNGHITNYSSPIVINNIRTNSPVTLKIKSNGWTTLPANYDTTNGSKKSDGSDSDFLLQVDTSSLYTDSGSMTVEGNFGTSFVAVTNSSTDLLKLGSTGSGGSGYTGVQNGSVNLFPRMLLDSAYDIAGDYIIELELIVADQL